MYDSFLRGSIIATEVRISKRRRKLTCCERTWIWVNEKYLKPLFGKKERDAQRSRVADSFRLSVLKSFESGHGTSDYKEYTAVALSRKINESTNVKI